MRKAIVAAVDGARARLFILRSRVSDLGETFAELDEVEDLVNPEHRRRPSDVYAESRPGLRDAAAGATGHGVDDHRSSHADEVDRRFAAAIWTAIAAQARDEGIKRVVVAAGPAMLGFLRETRAGAASSLELEEFPKQVSGLVPTEVHERLARAGLIPARRTGRRR